MEFAGEGLKEIPSGRELGQQEILFPRLEEAAIQEEIDKLKEMLQD